MPPNVEPNQVSIQWRDYKNDRINGEIVSITEGINVVEWPQRGYEIISDLSDIDMYVASGGIDDNLFFDVKFNDSTPIKFNGAVIYIDIDKTRYPTINPTIATETPTVEPTPNPSVSPTMSYWNQRQTEGISTFWSKNVFPLSLRNASVSYIDNGDVKYREEPMTYSTFKLDPDRPFDLTAILGWSEIDATLELIGCDDYDTSFELGDHISGPLPADNSFYFCDNGTWYTIYYYSIYNICPKYVYIYILCQT